MATDELFVDLAGLDRLYNQLVRASEDGTEALAYVAKNCKLNWPEQGLLFVALQTQSTMYQQVDTSFGQVRDLCSQAGTEVNRSQVIYKNTDHDSAAQLDKVCTGIADLDGLRQALSHTRADLDSHREAFADVTEPSRSLTSPEYAVAVEMWTINPLADLLSPSAWIRQACVTLLGVDPFEEWSKNLSGNWQAYVYAGNAMLHAGAAARAIALNLTTGAKDVGYAWRGNAAEVFQEFELNLGIHVSDLQEICRLYYKIHMDTAEVVKKLTDVLAGHVADFYDVLLMASGCLAAGTAMIETVFGAVAGYAAASYYSWMAWDIYQIISDLFGNAEDAIKLISSAVQTADVFRSVKTLGDVKPFHNPALR
ncbi:hypothetical protein GCM10010168_32580 [Actinoplanes ianthinogenes]|uniref:WXG100 family type VII secretion target n=1 Tax=Actinoplanes ianthinogenes TaxID=122358 RepID=A0ABM7LMB3_9ACTN|nr:hypothetical protein [Actinoplanes ianthinogenes]BCJ40398.1 hypothetical protein Aiant_10550 [Actinoplanes ianthinogenes]GGR11969.1 hypothetical protein GCM10010168_32580 [Actinoplanes ianthinogenes]